MFRCIRLKKYKDGPKLYKVILLIKSFDKQNLQEESQVAT
jgi:hypothetical protein